MAAAAAAGGGMPLLRLSITPQTGRSSQGCRPPSFACPSPSKLLPPWRPSSALVVSVLALFQSRAWLVLTGLFCCRSRDRRRSSTPGSSVLPRCRVNRDRRPEHRFPEHRQSQAPAGPDSSWFRRPSTRRASRAKDLEITWKYSGYCRAGAALPRFDFSIDSEAGTSFEDLDCVRLRPRP